MSLDELLMRPCHKADTEDKASGYVPNTLQLLAACAVIRRNWTPTERLIRERERQERHGGVMALFRDPSEPSCRAAPTLWTDRRRR